MAFGVGIDLGTACTKAAVCRDGELSLVTLEADSTEMPAVVRVAEEGLIAGAAAEDGPPERIVRGFRSQLGDPSPILVDAAPYSPETLLAALLTEAMTRVTAAQGQRPDRVVLTCPASWGPFRREQFDDVPVLAGVGDCLVVTEAQAIAQHWFTERHSPPGTTVAIYDLGGDVLEATVVRATTGLPDIVGTPVGTELVGGAAIDQTVADRWHLSLEQARQVKHELSHSDHSGPISRTEFDQLIEPMVRSSVQSLRDAIQSSGLADDQLAAILLAGGSSQIPVIQKTISATCGSPVQVLAEPSNAVVLGAAKLAGAELTRRELVPPPPAGGRNKVVWIAAAAAVVLVAAVAAILISSGNESKNKGTPAAAGPVTQASRSGTPAASGQASLPTLAIPTGTGPVAPYYVVAQSYHGAPEFMYEIAQRLLGNGNRNTQIFTLNKGRIQPDGKALVNITKITPGWILVLPADAKGPGVKHGPVPCCFGPTPSASG